MWLANLRKFAVVEQRKNRMIKRSCRNFNLAFVRFRMIKKLPMNRNDIRKDFVCLRHYAIAILFSHIPGYCICSIRILRHDILQIDDRPISKPDFLLEKIRIKVCQKEPKFYFTEILLR